ISSPRKVCAASSARPKPNRDEDQPDATPHVNDWTLPPYRFDDPPARPTPPAGGGFAPVPPPPPEPPKGPPQRPPEEPFRADLKTP
ncbi:conserved hypothetical protein, partial [Ricinus communis]